MKKLQRAALRDAVRVEVSSKYQTVDTLQQYYLFIPAKYKVPADETAALFAVWYCLFIPDLLSVVTVVEALCF